MPEFEKSAQAERRRTALACGALLLAGLALYARAVAFGFVDFDDHSVLLAHPNLYDEGSLPASLYQIFVAYFPREEPLLLRDVSWALDARVFGFENPRGYHLGNVVLNALNTVLLFLFLQHATRRFPFALGVAGVFLVLPVHVEPVCWVMGRKDVLAAFWMLLALLAQSHELSASRPAHRHLLYGLAFLCTGFAVLSKISAVVFFLVLWLHRVFQPHLDGSLAPGAALSRARALRAVPRLLPHAAISLLVFVWYQGIVREYGVIGGGPAVLDPEHLATVGRFAPLVLGEYLRHLIWPEQLSAYYRWPHVEIPLGPGQLLASAGLALATCGAVAICALRRRDLAFYLGSFLVFLAPHVGLAYVGIWMADRYIYLACFGLLAATATLLIELQTRAPWARLAVTALVLVFATGSAAVTWRQQPVWRDNEAFWTYEAHRDEPSLFAIQALAKLYVRRAEAEADPVRRRAWVEKAHAEIERGLARDRALARQPSRYRTPDQLHLSRLHSLRGRVAALAGAPPVEQLAHLERAYALAPDRVNAAWLARATFQLGAHSQGPEREQWVRRSFQYFITYLRYSESDPRLLAQSQQLLAANYDEARFPFLAEEIRQVRRTWFP